MSKLIAANPLAEIANLTFEFNPNNVVAVESGGDAFQIIDGELHVAASGAPDEFVFVNLADLDDPMREYVQEIGRILSLSIRVTFPNDGDGEEVYSLDDIAEFTDDPVIADAVADTLLTGDPNTVEAAGATLTIAAFTA